jgi:phosphomethylpyrimidine synthase
MSKARKSRDWANQIKLSVNPQKAKEYKPKSNKSKTCTMCGNYCSLKLIERYF